MKKNKPQIIIDTSKDEVNSFTLLDEPLKKLVSWIGWLDVAFLSNSVDHTQTLQVGCKQTSWLVIQVILEWKNKVSDILCTSLKSNGECKSDRWNNCVIKHAKLKITNPIKD